MIIQVDPSSPTPPYEQIRAQLAVLIDTGTLPAGTHLPAIRQLAADLGLAANTVARAYRELELEGFVISRVRHGTTVAPRPALGRAEIRRRIDEAAHSYAAIARQLGVDPDEAQARLRAAFHAGKNESAAGHGRADERRPDERPADDRVSSASVETSAIGDGSAR